MKTHLIVGLQQLVLLPLLLLLQAVAAAEFGLAVPLIKKKENKINEF